MITEVLSDGGVGESTASRLRAFFHAKGIEAGAIDGDRIAPIYGALRGTVSGTSRTLGTPKTFTSLPLPEAADSTKSNALYALIIETRRHPNLPFVIKQFSQLGIRIQLFHGTKNERFVRRSYVRGLIDDGRLILTSLGIPALTAGAYNALLLSRCFWNATCGRGKILLFQTDAILCARSPYGIQDFLSFDYIGATWPVRRSIGLVCHGGSGGLSLRDWRRTMECLERFPSQRWPGGEDGYFAFHMDLAGWRIGAPEDCARFATQSEFRDRSFGAHKISMLPPEQRAQFLEYCPEAAAILYKPHKIRMPKFGSRSQLKEALKVAVVVSTYNRPDALSLVLSRLLEQSDKGFEIIVADDGSDSRTKDVVIGFDTAFGKRLRFAWQPDQGFRVAAIRNRAIESTTAGYLIFLDGDCLPPPEFIRRHRWLAERGWFVTGSRILLSASLTKQILDGYPQPFDWTAFNWLRERWAGNVNRVYPTSFLPIQSGRHFRQIDPAKIRGCNLAAFRSDIISVGGFDESFEGWGGEDVDLAMRLENFGIRQKSGKFAVNVFHLWHTQNIGMPEENQRRIEDVVASGRTQAKRGIDRCTTWQGD